MFFVFLFLASSLIFSKTEKPKKQKGRFGFNNGSKVGGAGGKGVFINISKEFFQLQMQNFPYSFSICPILTPPSHTGQGG